VTEDAWREEVIALLVRGEKIAAIRVYREHTGADLAAAKAFVDGLQTTLKTGALPQQASSDLDAELLTTLREGQYIQAIKRYRTATGCVLKEAKDAVDALAAAHGIERRAGLGCLGSVALIVLVLVAACMRAARPAC